MIFIYALGIVLVLVFLGISFKSASELYDVRHDLDMLMRLDILKKELEKDKK